MSARMPLVKKSATQPVNRLRTSVVRFSNPDKKQELDKGFSVLELAGKVLPQGQFVAIVKTVWRFVWGRMMAELAPQDKSGAYARPGYAFDGVLGSDAHPLESGRYHLYLGNPCPWCHRVALVVALRGLAPHVTMTRLLDDPTKARRGGWCFASDSSPTSGQSDTVDAEAQSLGGAFGFDPVFGGCPDLYGVYEAAVPGFKGRCTAPLLVDKKTRTIISNESGDIVRMLGQVTSFDKGLTPVSSPVLRPAGMEALVDDTNEWLQELVNNGVYRCGFATSQSAYDAASIDVVAGLRKVEDLLSSAAGASGASPPPPPSGGPYLLGASVTEADVRLLPTALRFDAAYAPLFKAGGGHRRIRDFPHVDAWMRHMWSLEGVPASVDLEDAWGSYYKQLFPLNPGGIVPALPHPKHDLGLGASS